MKKVLLLVATIVVLLLVLSKFAYFHVDEKDSQGNLKVGAWVMQNVYGDKISCPVNPTVENPCDKYPSLLFFTLVLKK